MDNSTPTHESIKKLLKKSGTVLISSFVIAIILLFTKLAPVSILIIVAGIAYKFFIGSKIKNWSKDPALKSIVEDVKAELKEEQRQVKQTKSVLAKYEVGLEHLNLTGSYNLSSSQSGLVLKKSMKKDFITIPWEELLEVEAGSEADLRNRVTLSRLMLTGIFAFGLKKERKKGFYVTISTLTSLGLFELNTSGKNNRANEKLALVFASACNARIRSANPDRSIEVPMESPDKYKEIEKLGELLAKGLITQEEFGKKKAQILGIG